MLQVFSNRGQISISYELKFIFFGAISRFSLQSLARKIFFSKGKKELPLVALFAQEKIDFTFKRISATIGAKNGASIKKCCEHHYLLLATKESALHELWFLPQKSLFR